MKKIMIVCLIAASFGLQIPYANALKPLKGSVFYNFPDEIQTTYLLGFVSSAQCSMIWQLNANKKLPKEENLRISNEIFNIFAVTDWMKFVRGQKDKLGNIDEDMFEFFLYMLIRAQVEFGLREKGLGSPFDPKP